MNDKQALRKRLRAARRDHVAVLPPQVSALLFMRPPAALMDLVPHGAPVGLYRANPFEAPAGAYARWFAEAGHSIALPYFAGRETAMAFRAFVDPAMESDLDIGPYGLLQPGADAASIDPQVLFVPLVGFTERGERLGQGGGHYDRWLAAHPQAVAIGLAWDCQLISELPQEAHDRTLDAIVTPTRIFGPFA